MKRLKNVALGAAALATILASACAPAQVATSAVSAVTQPSAITNPLMAPAAASSTVVRASSEDPTEALAATIKLGDQISVEGTGAAASGNTVTISAAGAYRLTGTIADGQVVVSAKNSEAVKLILDGAGITSSTSAPIYVKSAKSVAVVLPDGSASTLVDGATRSVGASGSDEPNAALYSDVDLTIGGAGSLTVDARYNDGIASKDDLAITGGTISVTSVADGIRGRDRLDIAGGQIIVNAGKDGLKSSNDEDPEKGVVAISAGNIRVTAGGDGIQAETDVAISGGTIAISAGGGSTVSPTDDLSAKGIKGAVDVTIDGGTMTVDSADDAMHSNGSLVVRGGTLLLASGDDGMHADATLDVAGGEITISRAYEGIESARVSISDGRIRITSLDDGLNVAGGNDRAVAPVRPGQDSFNAASDNHLAISGGSIVIDSATDGIDANGSIEMTGGLAIIHGPTASRDGAIDYDRDFTISGGTLIAAGSAGMAQAPSTTSTQPSVQVGFPASQPGGTVVYIGDASGEDLLTFVPSKAFQSLVVSSPDLEQGATYVVQTGGSSTGTATDGLYSEGIYTAGTPVTSFTVAGAVTNAGTSTAGAGRFGGPRR